MSYILTFRNFFQDIVQRVSRILFRFPLRINFFLIVIASLWIYLSIHKNYTPEASLFTAILFVLLKVLLIIACSLFVICFLTAFVPYIRYFKKGRLKENEPQIQFLYENDKESENVVLLVKSATAIRPLFGALKIVLQYDNTYHTRKFELWKNKGNKNILSRQGAVGEYVLQLPEIKNYQLQSLVLFFEDMFHLFAFSVEKQMAGQFSILPQQNNDVTLPVEPRHAKEMVTRTNVVRRQEGEWLHFKSFEPADDVRRIVWSIYARNKELVVRMPERFNMYASQVSFYSSFYNSVGSELAGSHINTALLNCYKNHIWSLYSSLMNNKEIELKYVPDQLIKSVASPEFHEVMYQISASDWQTDKPVQEYFSPSEVSVLCVSSLISADDLSNVAHNATPSTVIVFVRLSHVYKINGIADAAQQLFIEPNEEQGKINKWRWFRSPVRPLILRNERKIKELFKHSDATFYEI